MTTLVSQLGVLVMKLTCFYIGYRIVRIGADLLRDGITGAFTFKADLHGAKADLAGASPGLLFVLLGALLVGYALWLPKTVVVESVEQRTIDAPPPVVALPGDLTPQPEPSR